MAFRATVDDGGDGIFSGNGGQITTIINSTAPFASFIKDGPWINDGGTVAFFATLDTGDEGIFTGSGGPITTIADASGGFASFGIHPSINSTDIVAFFATLDVGGQGIFTGNGGPLMTIADTSGPFASFGNRISIDNEDTITFSATLDMGGGAWFVGDGGPTMQIPDPGVDLRGVVGNNPLFSNAGLLYSPTQGMNASGQIAFFARYPDGTEAIYRAVPVPEGGVITALSPAKVWIGLKNSDAVGLRLDLLAEVFLDETKVGAGQLSNVASGSSGFHNAKLQTIDLILVGPVEVPADAELEMTLSVRRTCVGGGS